MAKQKADRAKLFAPFDALKGLKEALASQERIVVPKVELAEDALDELNRKIKEIEPLSIASIIYYDKGEYVKITGIIAKVDFSSHIVQVVQTKINMKDIYKIEIIEAAVS